MYTFALHHSEDGRNTGRNMLVRTLRIKYIINMEVHLLVLYIYVYIYIYIYIYICVCVCVCVSRVAQSV